MLIERAENKEKEAVDCRLKMQRRRDLDVVVGREGALSTDGVNLRADDDHVKFKPALVHWRRFNPFVVLLKNPDYSITAIFILLITEIALLYKLIKYIPVQTIICT